MLQLPVLLVISGEMESIIPNLRSCSENSEDEVGLMPKDC